MCVADGTYTIPLAVLDWRTRIQIARDAAAGLRVGVCVCVHAHYKHVWNPCSFFFVSIFLAACLGVEGVKFVSPLQKRHFFFVEKSIWHWGGKPCFLMFAFVDVFVWCQFLHESDPPVVHRDVKPNNILLDECYNAKVCVHVLLVSQSSFLTSQNSIQKTTAYVYKLLITHKILYFAHPKKQQRANEFMNYLFFMCCQLAGRRFRFIKAISRFKKQSCDNKGGGHIWLLSSRLQHHRQAYSEEWCLQLWCCSSGDFLWTKLNRLRWRE